MPVTLQGSLWVRTNPLDFSNILGITDYINDTQFVFIKKKILVLKHVEESWY